MLLSEGSCEFGERGRDSAMLPDVDAEFVVAAANVLHERETAHDHSGGTGAFESVHRSESGFEAAVVGFDPIVRVLLGVVERGRGNRKPLNAEPETTDTGRHRRELMRSPGCRRWRHC